MKTVTIKYSGNIILPADCTHSATSAALLVINENNRRGTLLAYRTTVRALSSIVDTNESE